MTTPKNDREPGPGEEEAEVAAGGRAGAERPAPAPATNEPPPVRQPVSFEQVNVTAAIEIATTAIKAAAVIVGDIDPYTYTQLTGYLVEEIAGGRAADGVHVTGACAATHTSRGHLPELYTGRWELTSQLAVRLITVMTERRVRFEDIYTHAAEISRDHHGLGMDHVPHARQTMHLIGDALATADSHTTAYALPLLIGTRDDVNAQTADLARIQEFAAVRGRSLPASWGQQVDELLAARRAVLGRLRARPELARELKPFGITDRDVLKGFSRTFVVRAMPFGPPHKRTRSSADLLVPAHEATLLNSLEQASGRALIFAGATPEPDGQMPPPEDLVRRGYRDLTWDAGELGDAFGVSRVAPWNVRYLFSRREQMLVRIEAGAGAWSEFWRLVGFNDGELRDAVALIERSREEWPTSCLDRAYIACAPGKLKTKDLRSQNAWRGMLRAADAALVAADRRMRQRHARS